ncbi:MAG: hypothetical protein FWG57_08665 [Endomicrobia bacterium]|nr:hypothetical protein [Endomicrobiia bacterium]
MFKDIIYQAKSVAMRSFFVLVSCIIIGFLLMLFVFSLPTDGMRENLKQSIRLFETEGVYPEIIKGITATRLDNWTDATMLGIAVREKNDDESALSAALKLLRMDSKKENKNPVVSLIDYLRNEPNMGRTDWGRYWLGFLVILKPLLLLFGYAQIRLISLYLLIALLVCVSVMIHKKLGFSILINFIISIMVLMPLTIPLSLHFSTATYIALTATAAVLLFYDKILPNYRYLYFFMIIGSCTSYVDFLSFPLITIGMPLIILILLMDKSYKLRDRIRTVGLCSIWWAIGYGGMWIGKWGINAIFVKDYKLPIDIFLTRISLESGTIEFTLKNVFSRSIEPLIACGILYIFIFVLVVRIARLIKRREISRQSLINTSPFLVIALMSPVWYIFASNHSYVHSWFTYRTWFIAVFALLSASSVLNANAESAGEVVNNKKNMTKREIGGRKRKKEPMSTHPNEQTAI